MEAAFLKALAEQFGLGVVVNQIKYIIAMEIYAAVNVMYNTVFAGVILECNHGVVDPSLEFNY